MKKFFRKKQIKDKIESLENQEIAEPFIESEILKEIRKHAYENGLVDEYTDTALRSISMGFRIEMVVGKRYSPNGLRVLAEVKEIYPELLTIYGVSTKTYDTTTQIGENLLFGNRGNPYTYDVAFAIENCGSLMLADFAIFFKQHKNASIELKTKEEILSFADIIEKIQNLDKSSKTQDIDKQQ